MTELLWVLLGIALLVVFNVKLKIHNLISLLVVGLFVAVCCGMAVGELVPTVTEGLGSIFGSLAIIIIFGAVIGKIMTDTGASQRIADTVVARCGIKYLPFGLLFVGVIFGIAMFYEVAFLIAAPLVLSIARKAKVPYMKLIIPVVAGCTMGHSLFPPQPGPTALVAALGASIPMVYVYGLITLVPALFCAGILLPRLVPGIPSMKMNSIMRGPSHEFSDDEMPSFAVSMAIPLIPAVLMIGASVLSNLFGADTPAGQVAALVGNANITMLITLFITAYLLLIRRGKTWEDASVKMTKGISQVANVLIVICAGGIFKQVIIDTGVANQIVDLVSGVPVSPYIIAWLITAIIRILTGQGAVAAITSAGMVAPLVPQFGLDPALMVICVACGSNTITLMYDGGFLLFKETFGISMKDTFKTWGLLELVNSVVGLAAVLALSLFV